MYVSRRNSSSEAKPARTIQRPSCRPARPENGCRLCRSTGPGACPTRKNRASARPAKTGAASGMMPSSSHLRHAQQSACRTLSSFLMFRLGLIGDTQGRYRVQALLDFVGERFAGVDEVWHAGDWQEDAVLEGLRRLGKPLTVVNGNAPDDPRFPIQVQRGLEGLEVGMVHRPPRPGDRWASELNICIHGHTHRWRDEIVGQTRFINVSTPTTGIARDRTIGILALDAGRAELERIAVTPAPRRG